MQKSRAFKIRFKQYLMDMFSDIAKSDGGFYKYFHPDAKNKKNFAQKDYFKKNFVNVQQLFQNDPMAYYKMNALTNAIFGRMLKDFHDKYYRLYLPQKVGENNYQFTAEQDVVLTRLTDSLIEDADVKEQNVADTPEKEEKRLQTQKFQALKDLEQRLQKSGFIIPKGGLKIDEETGLIEGQVQNENGEILNLEFDPETQDERNPGFIVFSKPNTELRFSITNTEPNLYLVVKFEAEEMANRETKESAQELQVSDTTRYNTPSYKKGTNEEARIGAIAETEVKLNTDALIPSIKIEETVQVPKRLVKKYKQVTLAAAPITQMAAPMEPQQVKTETKKQFNRYTEEDLRRKEYLKQQMSEEERERDEKETQVKKQRQQKKKKGMGVATLITGGAATGILGTAGYITQFLDF